MKKFKKLFNLSKQNNSDDFDRINEGCYTPSVALVHEIHISRLELQRRSLEFVTSFLKYIFVIWD